MTLMDDPNDRYDLFTTIFKGCFFIDHGCPPDFSAFSLDRLLSLARRGALLVEWPDAELLELQELASDVPATARAWLEARWQAEETSKRQMADSLKAQSLDTWCEALSAELQARRQTADRADIKAIGQALAQTRFLLEHRRDSPLRAAPKWDGGGAASGDVSGIIHDTAIQIASPRDATTRGARPTRLPLLRHPSVSESRDRHRRPACGHAQHRPPGAARLPLAGDDAGV